MKEHWKPWIYNDEITRYEISDMGQIHDIKKDIYTYGNMTREGYMQYTMYLNDGTAVHKLVHRLVAELFVYNPSDEYDVVDHINAIKNDNRAVNLRWCTNAMNIAYATEKGAMAKKKGEESPRHKYSKAQILSALDMLKQGGFTAREISEATGVHIHTVRDLYHGRVWEDELDGSVLDMKHGLKKFDDKQILIAISMLNGKYTVKEISKVSGVSKSVVRAIIKREIYKHFTDNIPELLYKKLSIRANVDDILYAISLLETKKYSVRELTDMTGLSRSILEKLVYKQRWTELTKGKDLAFKGSKRK